MFLIRHSKLVLILLGFLLSYSVLFIPGIEVQFNFRDFLIRNDPDLKFYEELEKEFEFENELLLIGLHNPPGVFEPNFLSELASFTRKCGRLSLVERSYSIATLNDAVASPLGLLSFPLIHVNDPKKYASDSVKISRDERYSGWLISEDFKTTMVVLKTENDLNESMQGELITTIDSMLSISGFQEYHVGGNMNTEIRYVRMIGHELTLNTILCSLVIILSLIYVFRSFAGVIIPTVTVISSLLIFFGGFGYFNRNFNLLSTLFPTIILIVGTSDIVHALSKYHHYLYIDLNREDAIKNSYRELLLPMFITSLTTAIGFFSLVTAPISPIKDFGIAAAIGVLLTFLFTILFVPAILGNIKKERFFLNRINDNSWNKVFDKIVHSTDKYRNRIILITVLILLFSLLGIMMINTNNKIHENFSDKSEVKKDFMFFEHHLSGVRSMKFAVVPAENLKINDLGVLFEIEKLHNHIHSFPETGAVFSPVTAYKSMNKSYQRGASKAYRLPTTQAQIDKLDKYFRAFRDQQLKLMNNDKSKGIVSAQIEDIGSEEMALLNEKIADWIGENINSEVVSFRPTGINYLADKSNNSLIRNMIISLLLAFVMVSLIMVLLYKNINLLLISLIPNIIPLIVAAGVMGYTGLVLNASTAVVFTIGFVIAVDNTIHFLSRFRIEEKMCAGFNEAIQFTFNKTGKAIVLTSVILLLNFWVLFRSEIKGVFAQGVLFSAIIVAALFGDLFLLPVLLRKYFKKKKQDQI